MRTLLPSVRVTDPRLVVPYNTAERISVERTFLTRCFSARLMSTPTNSGGSVTGTSTPHMTHCSGKPDSALVHEGSATGNVRPAGSHDGRHHQSGKYALRRSEYGAFDVSSAVQHFHCIGELPASTRPLCGWRKSSNCRFHYLRQLQPAGRPEPGPHLSDAQPDDDCERPTTPWIVPDGNDDDQYRPALQHHYGKGRQPGRQLDRPAPGSRTNTGKPRGIMTFDFNISKGFFSRLRRKPWSSQERQRVCKHHERIQSCQLQSAIGRNDIPEFRPFDQRDGSASDRDRFALSVLNRTVAAVYDRRRSRSSTLSAVIDRRYSRNISSAKETNHEKSFALPILQQPPFGSKTNLNQ